MNSLKHSVFLTFGLRNIPSKDLMSKSDPMIVLFERRPDGSLARTGRTEAIMNNENPDFTTKFPLDYFFEQEQAFRVEVYDVDHDNLDDTTKHDFIGYADFHLARVMSAAGAFEIILTKRTGEKRSKAKVLIRGEQIIETRQKAHVQISATKLDKQSFFGRDDTYLEFVRKRPDGSEYVVYKSEIIKENQSPKYKPFKLCMGLLCDVNLDQQFVIRVWSHKSSTKRELIGEISTNARTIMKESPQSQPKTVNLLNSKGKSAGTLSIDDFTIAEEHTFLDYIQGGLDFNVQVCIDFTASNGHPGSPQSLHFVDPTGQRRNQYIDAIRSIGSILSHYTGKQDVVAYGFGGCVSVDGGPQHNSHCFPLTLSSQHPFVQGVEGLVQAYCRALSMIQLSGPTNFAEIIRASTAATLRPYTATYQHYTILLILTDGVISDMKETIDQIVGSSDKPLSVIIVGVGQADFSAMDQLDGDDHRLFSQTLGYARRDIVQFVPFLRYAQGHPSELSRVTLAEVPRQVLDFMNSFGIRPLVRQPGQSQEPQQSQQPQQPQPQ